MSAYINNEDKLIDLSHKKELLSALNRLGKAFKNISDLGYHCYITPDGVNAMTIKSQDQSDVAASVSVYCIDCGDW